MIAPASQTPVSTAPPFWQRWFSGNGWISLASVATVLALWWVASHAGWVSPLFLPTPEAVIKAFADIVVNGYKGVPLLFHIWESLYRLGVALVLAVVIAVPLGMACGAFDKLRAVVEPLIEFYRPLPPLAYYTLLVIWLGIENASKIALLFLAAFAPLFLAAVAGVQRVPRDRILGSQSLGANRWQIFRYVIFPSVLPDLFTGLRTAIGFAYTTLVAAEMVAAVSGIGWMVLDASKFLRSDVIFVGIFIMGGIAVALDWLLRWVMRSHLTWVGRE